MRHPPARRRPPHTRRTAIADVLRQRIMAGIHLGLLDPGDRLPSVRAVAAEQRSDPRVALVERGRLNRRQRRERG